MAYTGLISFIHSLQQSNELHRIKTYVDPELEITEITDRIVKNSGKALLFENNGTEFPVLINAFGSDKRMAMAMSRENLDDAGLEITNIPSSFSASQGSFFKKLSALPLLLKMSGLLPGKHSGKGICQQVIHEKPDLSILPVLKCWPFDGGRFITLPLVHTKHPETGLTNLGMYRMQILDKNTTAIHWQRHKTGANHYEAWKEAGRIMPVTVALGGDPVYTYSATAPLPENIDEYILAGFLRKKKVRMVKCITNELYVPYDADIIIEGYVDPSEDLVWEGPFGDHTGFYSLADWYPKFHVTCITHSRNAVYPATIVGVPPQEDAFLAKATEKIFLSPVRLSLLPEIIDFHLPEAGVAHNLVIVKINKSYPGQGMKVANSLSGTGQMMFTKYLVVVSGNIDIRNFKELLHHIFIHFNPGKDLAFNNGPLDVLDHASDAFSFGGKALVDATIKLPEELSVASSFKTTDKPGDQFFQTLIIAGAKGYNRDLSDNDIPVLVLSVNPSENKAIIKQIKEQLKKSEAGKYFRLILIVDHSVDISDYYMIAWQLLGNTDPQRDHDFPDSDCLLIDGTIKAYREGGFARRWPNVVSSDDKTILVIDQKWETLGLGDFIPSPSLKFKELVREGKEEINVNG